MNKQFLIMQSRNTSQKALHILLKTAKDHFGSAKATAQNQRTHPNPPITAENNLLL